MDDITVDLPCSLEEMFMGTVKRLAYDKITINLDGRTTSTQKAFVDVEIFKGYNNGYNVRFSGQGNEAPGYQNGKIKKLTNI